MTRAWDKEKIWVPDRNRTHDHCVPFYQLIHSFRSKSHLLTQFFLLLFFLHNSWKPSAQQTPQIIRDLSLVTHLPFQHAIFLPGLILVSIRVLTNQRVFSVQPPALGKRGVVRFLVEPFDHSTTAVPKVFFQTLHLRKENGWRLRHPAVKPGKGPILFNISSTRWMNQYQRKNWT